MIEATDRGFLLGDGVFETLLVANRVALWRDEHLTRMKKAARKLDIPFDRDGIEAVMDTKIDSADASVRVMRVTLSRGTTARGLAAEAETPTLVVSLDPLETSLIGKPMTLATSSIRRNPASVTDRHKTTSYANNVFAAREARSKDADDALMLNQDGLVACTSIANIFVVNGTALATPPEQDGVLPGIMRRFLIEHAPGFGYTVEVRSIEKDELADAEGVFVTNSLRLVSPVAKLDGAALPTVETTALLNAMLDAAKAQCGIDLLEKLR